MDDHNARDLHMETKRCRDHNTLVVLMRVMIVRGEYEEEMRPESGCTSHQDVLGASCNNINNNNNACDSS
jgi:hypothetical protein